MTKVQAGVTVPKRVKVIPNILSREALFFFNLLLI